MKLELRSIISPGDIKKERLTLRAKSALDVGDYLVAQTMYVDDTPSTAIFHSIWFPFKKIEKGDLVVIYTKEGDESSRVLDGGHQAHFYYLDKKEPIWDDPNLGALVLNAPTWDAESSDRLIRR